MKKIVAVVFALSLAVPAICFAGSATSRWDMTIGGYVKFDVGWADQLVGPDYAKPYRDSAKGTRNNILAEEDNLYWAGGETRLNFSIKGPDARDAKTSAFVEGDFRGTAGSGTGTYKNETNNYNMFTLRHAYMKFDWPKTSVLLGQTWQAWGVNQAINVLGFNESHFYKGGWIRTPQIRVTQKVSKDFTVQVAAAGGASQQLTSGGNNYWNESTTSLMPHFSGEVIYASEALGKVGPFGLRLGLGGFVGRDKFYYSTQDGADYSSDAVTTYSMSLYWNVPVIRAKLEDKKGGLTLSGNAFVGKGIGLYAPFYPGALVNNGAYSRATNTAVSGTGSNTTGSIEEPLAYGGWTQAAYYFTDKFFVNGLYGFQRNVTSDRYSKVVVPASGATANQFSNSIKFIDTYIVSVMYDINPAVRFGLEYTRLRAQYGWYTFNSDNEVTQDRDGTLNSVRFGAYYFF